MQNHAQAVDRRLADPAFNRTLLQRSYLVIACQAVVIAALVAQVVWQANHPPRSHYFYTDGVGTPREMHPLDAPVMPDEKLLAWVSDAVIAAYSVDFKRYPEQLSRASRYFTVEGWNTFGRAFIETGNLEKVKKARLVATAVPKRAPAIRQRAVIGDRLAWRIDLPIVVSYENENTTNSQDLMVTVLVVRVIETDYADGIAIDEINAPPA